MVLLLFDIGNCAITNSWLKKFYIFYFVLLHIWTTVYIAISDNSKLKKNLNSSPLTEHIHMKNNQQFRIILWEAVCQLLPVYSVVREDFR